MAPGEGEQKNSRNLVTIALPRGTRGSRTARADDGDLRTTGPLRQASPQRSKNLRSFPMFALTRNLWTSRKTTGRRTSYKPHFEALERREVLSAVPLTNPAVVAVVAPADAPSPTPAGLALINSLPD